MAKHIDFEWLKTQANNEASKQWIAKIAEWRKFTLENNKFIDCDDLFSLSLGNYQFWFKKSSAFSSIEVYYEIFKENNHFLIPEIYRCFGKYFFITIYKQLVFKCQIGISCLGK